MPPPLVAIALFEQPDPSLDNIHKSLGQIKKAEGKKKPADKMDTDAVARNKKKAESPGGIGRWSHAACG